MAIDGDGVLSERFIDQPPSCIECCPADPSFFVVGTYKLEESKESSSPEGTASHLRLGRVELYQIRKSARSSGFGVSQCIDKYDFPDSAVLDLHFRPQDPTFFAVCTSTSQTVFFRLEIVESEDPPRPSIRHLGSFQIGEDDAVLATAFTWEPQPDTNLLSFAVAFSSGDVKVFGLSERDFQISSEVSIDQAHSLEAWTLAFAGLPSRTKDGKMLLTGGDDSILAFHSIVSETDSDCGIAVQLFQDRKSHTAGVTAILPIFEASHVHLGTGVFVTGSYDEHIRVFTLEESPPYKRKIVAELSLGGGVWRLRTLLQLPCEEFGGDHVCSVLLLASCMHAGVRIVRIARRVSKNMNREACTWEIEVVGAYTEGHESMVYGADSVSVRKLTDQEAEGVAITNPSSGGLQSGQLHHNEDLPHEFVIVSTSFYDRKICVWSFHYEGAAVVQVNTKLDSIDSHSNTEEETRFRINSGSDNDDAN